MPRSTKLTRAEQKALRPAQILEAAFEEFVKQSYAATRVEDIAAQIGVTKGTVYFYFETKENLFEKMIEHISGNLLEMRAALNRLDGSPIHKLIDAMGLMHDYLVQDRRTRELLRFVISEGDRFPDLIDRHHREFVLPVMEAMTSILEEGVTKGQFRKESAPIAELLIAPIITDMVFRLIFDKRHTLTREAFLKANTELVLHGLLP